MWQRFCVLQRVIKQKYDLIQHMYVPPSHRGSQLPVSMLRAACSACFLHRHVVNHGKERRRKEDEGVGGVRARFLSLRGWCETMRVELLKGGGTQRR